MTRTRRFIACILTVIMLSSIMAPLSLAAAHDESCSVPPTIVIPGIFQSDVKMYDENGNVMLNSDGEPYKKPFFTEATNDIIKDALENALLPIAKMVITQRDKDNKSAQAIADVLGRSLFGNIKADKNGNTIKNIKAADYNTALSNLSEADRNYALGRFPRNAFADKIGLDHLYFFSYVSTGNLIATANRLYDLIQTAKKESGHDKVNLLPISQGGSIFNALMQLYRDKGLEFSDDVNRVCFIVPAADGAAVLGDIYRYGLLDDADALYGYMFPSLLDDDQQALAYLVNIILRILPSANVNAILDLTVDTLIEDYLENITCLWALIPSGDYPACREKYLSDSDSTEIVKQTDWYYNAQLNHRSYILEEKEKGVEFFDIVDYNYPLYKICDSWDKVNADGIIHTDSESFGAATAAVDVPLADDYSPEKSYCTNASHNHFDADRLVDASAGILCETTFFFKGQDHETTARNSVIIRLATKILSDNTFSDVYSDPAFPQFNFARDSHDFEDYLAYWRSFDRSTLTPENREKLENALASAEAAVNSTYMPTEEFDKIKDDFYSTVYEIQNGSPEPEETPDILLEFITELLKWYSELLLKLYGSKGWHDIIFH